MASSTDDREIVHVSDQGQVTIPEALREPLGIETPGRVLVREEDGKIVVEPVPSVEEMRGVRAGRYAEGAVLQYLHEMRTADW